MARTVEQGVAGLARLSIVVAAVAVAACSSSPGGGSGAAGASGSGAGTGGHGGSSGGASGGAGTSTGGVIGAAGAGGAAGGGGGGGAAGNPFAGATPLTVGANPTSGTLADATSARDSYSFSGTQGELIQITTTTGGASPFDPTALDLVITLYDPSGKQLAQAGDPWPRVTDAPALYTALPAAGTYYISAANCRMVLGASSCRATTPIVNRGYTIRVADLGGPTLIQEGAEPGNNAVAGAAALTYTKAGGTSYQPLLLYGLFQSTSDQDTYTFTVPADVDVASGARARANFWIQPTGRGGDGSTAAPGVAYVIDPSDTSGAHVVELDDFQFGTGIPASDQPANLSFPVMLGKSYTFVLANESGLPPGANGFYFVQHLGGADANAPLLEKESNDTQGTADSLAAIDNLDGSYSFTVDGDLNPPATDLDFHHLQLPPGLTTINGSCVAQRQGSGLTSLLYKLVKSDGTVQFQQTETGNTDSTIGDMQIPAGGLTIAVSASGQLAGITNSSYVCRFVAKP